LKNIPTTLLYHGPSGSGKLKKAKEFAAELTTGSADVRLFAPEGKSEMYAISAIHELIQEVALPPFQSERRVFILDDIERMLPVHANALLKTLEEPTSKSVLLMLTSNLGAVLPTIRSRAIAVPFFPGKDKFISEINVLGLIRAGLAKDFSTMSTESAKIEGAIPEEEKRHLFVEDVLRHIFYWFRDCELLKSGGDKKLLFWPEESLVPQSFDLQEIFTAIEKARLGFDRNLRLRHCLEQIFLQPISV